MNKAGLVLLVLLAPASAFAEANPRKDLWEKVGVELDKPFLRNYVVVDRVREGSLAAAAGLQRGDRLQDVTALGSCEDKTASMRKMPDGDKVKLSQAMLDVSNTVEVTAGKKACLLTSELRVILLRNGERGLLWLSSGYRYQGIGAYMGHDNNSRVLITGVLKNGPAERGGLQEDDVVVSVNRVTAVNSSQVTEEIRSKSLGTKLEVVVMRESNKKATLNLTTDWIVVEPRVDLLFPLEKAGDGQKD